MTFIKCASLHQDTPHPVIAKDKHITIRYSLHKLTQLPIMDTHKQSNTLYFQRSLVKLHRSCILHYYKKNDGMILLGHEQ